MSRHRTRRDHHRTKNTRQKQQRHYKLMGQTMALTVALATSNALPQDADKRETFTFPPVDVQDQRAQYNPTKLKGPSAVLFGRGSTGGVINQTSKTPPA